MFRPHTPALSPWWPSCHQPHNGRCALVLMDETKNVPAQMEPHSVEFHRVDIHRKLTPGASKSAISHLLRFFAQRRLSLLACLLGRPRNNQSRPPTRKSGRLHEFL